MVRLCPILVSKKDASFPPTLFILSMDELETYLDEINGGSLYLFNVVVAILLYADDVVMLLESRVSFQRLLNKLCGFCISSHLAINLPKTKIMIFGQNRKKLN